MKKYAKSVFKSFFPRIYAFLRGVKLLCLSNSYLAVTGFMRTLHSGQPCRPDGSFIPWMNYSVVAFLEQRLNNSMKLFEYGSGYSTLFYSNLVSTVTSIEHNKGWFDKMQNKLPSNVELRFVSLDDGVSYCNAIGSNNQSYDVVVVDGRYRVRCVESAAKSLSEKGVIILDDSEREKYKEAVDYLVDKGFKKIDFEGLKPAQFSMSKTTVFYRSNNCLNI